MKAENMERIGEYLVRRMVGEGGMGKVFEAEERLSHRRVALKVLRPELSKSEEGRRLFLNEMTILAHLDHQNVVRCLACAEIDGELVMVLEFLVGRTLREVLRERGALTWEEAVDVTRQIAAALAAAHQQEPAIVHRDLKPENVMILADGSVKVMDFGIAKVLQALSKATTHSVGTLQYMSPEQIDAAGVDARSDLYCLGLLLFEMLSGKPPFQSASPRELLDLQCTAAPPPLSDELRRVLPNRVERLLFELLEKRPDDRPGSAADVLYELEPFVPAGGVIRLAPGAEARAAGAARSEPVPEVGGGAASPRSEEANGASEPDGEASGSAGATGGEETTSTSAERDAEGAPSERAERGLGSEAASSLRAPKAPREVPARAGLMIVLLLSIIAGLLTYIVRATDSSDTPGDVPGTELSR